MTAQLNRERLEEKLLEHIKHGGDSEEETMVRMLLSGMDSEPVAWIVHARQGDMLTSDGDFVANAEGISSIRSTPLYTAPPAPVAVPDDLKPDAAELEFQINLLENFEADDGNTQLICWLKELQRRRAAMLKAGPVTAATVPDGWKLVPVEPTAEMCKAGYEAQDKWPSEQCDNFKERHYSFSQPRYKAMLAAAPAAPEQEV